VKLLLKTLGLQEALKQATLWSLRQGDVEELNTENQLLPKTAYYHDTHLPEELLEPWFDVATVRKSIAGFVALQPIHKLKLHFFSTQ
jgi:hypothetical protein